jgi:cell wall-associated NlpC family hydrolase
MRYIIVLLFISFIGISFGFKGRSSKKDHTCYVKIATVNPVANSATGINTSKAKPTQINTTVNSGEYVAYAKTLIGTPYLYASTDPSKGLDCSGFVNHVSHHFGLKVPRSSVDFTNFGNDVAKNEAIPGDLILFTGTDASTRIVGHMGIVTNNAGGQIQFIHSSSGKAKGVTISDLKGYYETRFVKIIRIMA